MVAIANPAPFTWYYGQQAHDIARMILTQASNIAIQFDKVQAIPETNFQRDTVRRSLFLFPPRGSMFERLTRRP